MYMMGLRSGEPMGRDGDDQIVIISMMDQELPRSINREDPERVLPMNKLMKLMPWLQNGQNAKLRPIMHVQMRFFMSLLTNTMSTLMIEMENGLFCRKNIC